ncbi:NAD(P)H-dependent flavin oxidoreductase [Chloroflexota bacterium]
MKRYAGMKTRITEMLGIRYPIIQGGMGWVSEPPLVAAVSNAGGFGILIGTVSTPEELVRKIQEVRKLTDAPFGVNFTPTCDHLEANLEVCINEKVVAVTYGKGKHTTDFVSRKLWPHSVISIPVTATVSQAIRVEQEGAAAVVVSGMEGGGHVSRIGSMILLPKATKKVKIPVIAAGGFGDGRGLAAALVLGADAVQMGTRFICVKESPVPDNVKQFLLSATEEDTLVTGHISGVRMRVLRNKLTEAFIDLEDKRAKVAEFEKLGLGKLKQAYADGDTVGGSLAAGQIVGLVNDIPTCQELLESMISEAKDALGAVWAKSHA